MPNLCFSRWEHADGESQNHPLPRELNIEENSFDRRIPEASNTGRRLWWLLLPLGAVFFIFHLGWFGLVGPDEPRYAQVAREMARSGDWITPRIANRPWLEKPILLYWLQAAGMKMLGVNEWSARVPSALAALAVLLALYAFGRSCRSALCGLACAGAFASTMLAVAFARGGTQDMLLAASVGGGLLLFFLAQDDRRRWRGALLAGFYACLGIGLLAKGLVGALIPGMIIAAYGIVCWRSGTRLRLDLLRGGLVAIGVASVWYIPMLVVHGRLFIDEFIISHHFQRFTSNKFHHPGPFYFYLPVLFAGAFPWSAFLVSSSGRLAGDGWCSTDPKDRLNLFCWLWIAAPVIFFSFSASKLPGYLAPVFPAVALLIGWELTDLMNGVARAGMRRACLATPLIFAGMLIPGLWYASRRLELTSIPQLASAEVVFGVSAVLFVLALKRHYRGFVLGMVLSSAGLVFFLTGWVMPEVARRESMKETVAALEPEWRRDEPVIGYFVFPHGLTFYTDARSVYDDRGDPVVFQSPEDLLRLLDQHGSVVVVTAPPVMPALQSDARLRVTALGGSPDYAWARLERASP